MPGFPTVVGALDDLAEPSAGLRGVYAVGIRPANLQVIPLPAGEVRAGNVPVFPLAIRSKDECAFAHPVKHSYFAHA